MVLDAATMDDVRKDIENVMNAIQFPAGYSWKFGRGFRFQDNTESNMIRNIVLAMLFIYIIMAALFESLLHPLSIITGIFFFYLSAIINVHLMIFTTLEL